MDVVTAAIVGALREGRAGAVATITRTRGSTYRREGARMWIPAVGDPVGSLSGGCLEGDVVAVAAEVIATGRPRRVGYDMTADDDALWGLGLGCNGAVEVLIEPLQPGHGQILNWREAGRRLAVVVPLPSLEPRDPVGGEPGAEGKEPPAAGAEGGVAAAGTRTEAAGAGSGGTGLDAGVKRSEAGAPESAPAGSSGTAAPSGRTQADEPGPAGVPGRAAVPGPAGTSGRAPTSVSAGCGAGWLGGANGPATGAGVTGEGAMIGDALSRPGAPGDGAMAGEPLPRRQLVVGPEGGTEGSLGSPELDGLLAATAREWLAAGRTGTLAVAGVGEFFIETVLPPPVLLVCGAGHDAVPVVDAAAPLGYEVVVVDSRPAFARPERFPRARRVIRTHPEDLGRHFTLDDRTFVVIMTHNFLQDAGFLAAVLDSPVRYIGLLGPRRRAERLLAELRQRGMEPPAEQLARIHAPVGLDIGGETPEEIACSLLAEVQAVRHGRPAGFLRDRQGPIHPRVEEERARG